MKNNYIGIQVILLVILLAGCGQDGYEKPENAINVEESSSKEVECKEFLFTSTTDVENLTDEDLIFIASNNYSREDFFEEGAFATIDLFDVPMFGPTSENPENASEYIMTIILDERKLEKSIDLETPIDADFIKEYAEEDMKDFFDKQNSKKPGDDTGSLALERDIIYCGENDSYVEYSARYVESRTYYRNDKPVTNMIPRAYRRVYLKSFVWTMAEDNRRMIMLGDLNKEIVQEQLDLFLNTNDDVILYREVTENEAEYIYTYYGIYMCYGDFGLNDTVNLYRGTMVINKENHEVMEGGMEDLKEVEVPGTS